MRTKRSIKDSLKEYLNWCVGRLLLGGSRDDTVRDMVDAISDEIASEGDRVLAEKGQPGGLAELDESGRVPSSQLPSYVDDVINVATYSQLPNPGESGKIYITEDTNLTYRWSGTGYAEISPSLALGTTAETAGRGDWTHEAYNHSLIKDGSNPHKTTFASLPDKDGVWTSDNFKPDSKLNYSGFGGDLDTISTSGMYRLLSGCTNIPLGSSQGCFLLHTNWDAGAAQQMYFFYSTTDIYIRNKVNGEWKPWQKVWNAGNFNPDSKFNNLGKTSDSNNVVGNGYTLKELGATFSGPFLKWGLPGHMFEFFSANRIDEIQIRHMSQGVWGDPVIMYHSGNLGNATTSQAGLMSSADKIKLDGLSDQINVFGQASSTYIFPGDPSKLSEVDSPTNITSILGTASDFLDAFNNGKVFVSKTVTFSGVSVPSDITYNVLKSEDPDNPTIFSIIMSTVVWGHYIEITIDFENNEYQAISNTINGIIGVNNTGTTN